MKMHKLSARWTVAGAVGAVLLCGYAIYATTRSESDLARANDPQSRVRPALIKYGKRLRDELELTADQIEKYHVVERKYKVDYEAVLHSKKSRPERNAMMDAVEAKIDAGVKPILSAGQYAKLLEIQKEQGRFRHGVTPPQ